MKFYFFFAFLVVTIATSGQIHKRMLAARSDSASFRRDLYVPDRPLIVPQHSLRRAFAVPALFFAASLYTATDNENFDREEVKEERDELTPNFHHSADNYLQYAPIAAVYGLNLVGIKGKNDLANRTALLLKTELLVAAITFPLKRITAVPRPDTGQRNSFPSGHTAQAFAAATFMSKEYGHISVWYSIGAYSVATTVGAMRILNNRHWVTDVLAGAGIGILSTNIVYLTHRYTWGHHGKNTHGTTMVVPSYDGRTGMISIVRTIH